MKQHRGIIALVLWMSVSIVGCVTNDDLSSSQQVDIGTGIVLGTLGTQQSQDRTTGPPVGARAVKGQVVKIEGGAYVVRDLVGNERRLPLDQNTTIDRPAHVGDWLEAYLDPGGRATNIRNVDDEIEWIDELSE